MQGTASHTYRSELFPTHMRAKAVGFIYSFSRMSSALSSYLIAIVLMSAGVNGVFIFMAVVMGFSVIVTLCFGPRTRGRAYEELEDPRPLNHWTSRSAASPGQHKPGTSDGPQPTQPSPH
jgi:MFS family permease